MGERVEWDDQDRGEYSCAYGPAREPTWFAYAYTMAGAEGTAWAGWYVRNVETNAIIVQGHADNLASAKLAAEAALRERGLLPAEAPRTIDVIASALAAKTGWSATVVDDSTVTMTAPTRGPVAKKAPGLPIGTVIMGICRFTTAIDGRFVIVQAEGPERADVLLPAPYCTNFHMRPGDRLILEPPGSCSLVRFDDAPNVKVAVTATPRPAAPTWERSGNMQFATVNAPNGERWLVTVWDDGEWEIVDNENLCRLVAKGNGGTEAAEEWLRVSNALGSALPKLPALPDVTPVLEAWRTIAAAMQSPEGRRVLAAQAVEEAVAEGARRGLDAEALRVALVGCCERAGGHISWYGLAMIAIARGTTGAFPDAEGFAISEYRRALAARLTKPLGRPPRVRGKRGREW